mgnify:CR=1 FL=1
MGVKRLVIDSVMTLAIYFQNEDERKKGFLKLIDNIIARVFRDPVQNLSAEEKNVRRPGLPVEISKFWLQIAHFSSTYLDMPCRTLRFSLKI